MEVKRTSRLKVIKKKKHAGERGTCASVPALTEVLPVTLLDDLRDPVAELALTNLVLVVASGEDVLAVDPSISQVGPAGLVIDGVVTVGPEDGLFGFGAAQPRTQLDASDVPDAVGTGGLHSHQSETRCDQQDTQ